MAVSWVINSAYDGGAGQRTVPVPVEVEDDDLIIMVHSLDNEFGVYTSGHWPTGFVDVTGSPWTGCAADSAFSVGYKIASSEGSNWTFQASPDDHDGHWQGAVAIVLRGVDTSSPIDAIAYVCDTTPATTDNPSVTVSSTGSYVVAVSGTDTNGHTQEFQDDAQFPDIPGSLSNEFYSDYSALYHSIVGASGAFGPGATGILPFGCGTGSAKDVTAVSIAISPATGERRVMVIS
jgi:hypothetical protein